MPYAVYIPVRQGETYLIHSIEEKEEDAWSSAGERRDAVVIWGLKDTLPSRLTKAEALQRARRKPGPETGPIATD